MTSEEVMSAAEEVTSEEVMSVVEEVTSVTSVAVELETDMESWALTATTAVKAATRAEYCISSCYVIKKIWDGKKRKRERKVC